VALVDECGVAAVQALQGARGLVRAKATAVAKGGGKVALAWAVELGLEARDRAEVPGPAQPVLGVGEGFQDADRRHVHLEQTFQEGRAVGRLLRAQPLHYGFATNNLDVLVLWEGPVGCGGGRGEASLQGGDERAGVGGHASLLGVALDVALVFLPGYELVAVVTVLVAAGNAEVAGLQLVDHLGEQANLEMAPVHLDGCGLARRPPGQPRPPLLAHEGQVDQGMQDHPVTVPILVRHPQLGLAMGAVRQQEGDRLFDGAIL
jgi:hypothetical protein